MIAGVISAAQADSPAKGTGPLYTVEALRAFELYDIHLGMRAEEARKALTTAGLKLRSRDPEAPTQDVIGEGYEVPGSNRPGELWSRSTVPDSKGALT